MIALMAVMLLFVTVQPTVALAAKNVTDITNNIAADGERKF